MKKYSLLVLGLIFSIDAYSMDSYKRSLAHAKAVELGKFQELVKHAERNSRSHEQINGIAETYRTKLKEITDSAANVDELKHSALNLYTSFQKILKKVSALRDHTSRLRTRGIQDHMYLTGALMGGEEGTPVPGMSVDTKDQVHQVADHWFKETADYAHDTVDGITDAMNQPVDMEKPSPEEIREEHRNRVEYYRKLGVKNPYPEPLDYGI